MLHVTLMEKGYHGNVTWVTNNFGMSHIFVQPALLRLHFLVVCSPPHTYRLSPTTPTVDSGQKSPVFSPLLTVSVDRLPERSAPTLSFVAARLHQPVYPRKRIPSTVAVWLIFHKVGSVDGNNFGSEVRNERDRHVHARRNT